MMMTGMLAPFSFSVSSSSTPFISGIIMSARTTSGTAFFSSSASSIFTGFMKASTSNPSLSRTLVKSFPIFGSSSTMYILFFIGWEN